MKLYDIERMSTVNVPKKKCTDFFATIESEHILNKSYVEYSALIRKALKEMIKKDLVENAVFNIELLTNDELDYEDLDQFYIYTVSALCDMLVAAEPRDRERRLSVDTTGLNINYMSMMKLINNKTKINCFTINFYHNNHKISLTS